MSTPEQDLLGRMVTWAAAEDNDALADLLFDAVDHIKELQDRRTSSDAALRDAVLEEAIATLGRIILPAVISPHYDGVRDGIDLAVEAIRALSTSQEQQGVEGQKPHSHLD